MDLKSGQLTGLISPDSHTQCSLLRHMRTGLLQSILLASPTCLITALRIRSARSIKQSGILGRVCISAMACMMTAEGFGRISTPSSRSFARVDLFVLASEPSQVARDQGTGPSS